MAMMHLLARWAPLGGVPVLVATVDHGLRPESAGEAAFVAQEAARLGLPHRTLPWTGSKPATGLQAAAREARYGLLAAHAREWGATHLTTAHTLDDQAETVLMRMAHGSGLAGLSGMRRERDVAGIRHVRPLLGLSKADLRATCAVTDFAYVEDPSNADERFERVRWRGLMAPLARAGLTARRLSDLADRAARAEAALREKAQDALSRSSPLEGNTFDATCLLEEPFDIALRVLDLALAGVGPGGPRRLNRLETCLARLRAALGDRKALRLTVAGLVLNLDRSGRLTIAPEGPRHRGR
jgi:tRNA(Ile)-lysidine synthase